MPAVVAAVHAWTGEDGPRGEVAEVVIDGERLRAAGTQLWLGPAPHRVDYVVATHRGFATATVAVVATGDGWERRTSLVADGAGRWEVDGVPAPALDGALDVDIGWSPLTNTLPVLRTGMAGGGGAGGPVAVDLVAAWVAVPSLAVAPMTQRYERVGEGRVRYRSDRFTAVLDLDADGLVVRYPGLATRVGPSPPG